MWKLTLVYGTRDGFHFVSPLVFGVGPKKFSYLNKTHPPKSNETTLITTFGFVLCCFFVVQRFELFVFISLGEWAFCSCIFFMFPKLFQASNIPIACHNIFCSKTHCQVRLGSCVQHMHIFQCKFVSPFKTKLWAVQRKKKKNPNLFPLLLFKEKVGMDPLFGHK